MAGRPRRAGHSPGQRHFRTRPRKDDSRRRGGNHHVLRRRLSFGADGGRRAADGLSQCLFAHRRVQSAGRGPLANGEMSFLLNQTPERRLQIFMKSSLGWLALVALPLSVVAEKKPGETASVEKVEIQGEG